MCVCVYVHTHTHTYIYIYIYIYLLGRSSSYLGTHTFLINFSLTNNQPRPFTTHVVRSKLKIKTRTVTGPTVYQNGEISAIDRPTHTLQISMNTEIVQVTLNEQFDSQKMTTEDTLFNTRAAKVSYYV
jgi:hypothetical protein